MTAYLTSDDFDQNLLDVRYFSGMFLFVFFF